MGATSGPDLKISIKVARTSTSLDWRWRPSTAHPRYVLDLNRPFSLRACTAPYGPAGGKASPPARQTLILRQTWTWTLAGGGASQRLGIGRPVAAHGSDR